MKKYTKPEVELSVFTSENTIMTSGINAVTDTPQTSFSTFQLK